MSRSIRLSRRSRASADSDLTALFWEVSSHLRFLGRLPAPGQAWRFCVTRAPAQRHWHTPIQFREAAERGIGLVANLAPEPLTIVARGLTGVSGPLTLQSGEGLVIEQGLRRIEIRCGMHPSSSPLALLTGETIPHP